MRFSLFISLAIIGICIYAWLLKKEEMNIDDFGLYITIQDMWLFYCTMSGLLIAALLPFYFLRKKTAREEFENTSNADDAKVTVDTVVMG